MVCAFLFVLQRG